MQTHMRKRCQAITCKQSADCLENRERGEIPRRTRRRMRRESVHYATEPYVREGERQQ
jgi:hypothetical protein